jgi:hypothetical protein
VRFPNKIKILTLAILGVLLLPAFLPISLVTNRHPVMVSYNPAPANRFHSPLSSMGLIAVTGARPNAQSPISATSRSTDPSSLKTIQQNALRFIIDNSYFPQSETTIAVDPANQNHVLGGFNDGKFLACFVLPADCGSAVPASLSGFTVSTDGGRSVAKSGSIPDLNITGTTLDSWGDPSVAATVEGNFFYASLAIDPFGSFDGNGIMIAESNPNLFNPSVSCTTSVSNSSFNPCWKAVFVYGSVGFPVFSFDDKDRIAVDRNPSSPFFGSVYVGWDHFTEFGESASYLARCDRNLVSCTMLSGAGQPLLSGSDPLVSWTTPLTDNNGNVHVAWCNFGTFLTFGPITCKTNSAPPGGTTFGTPSNILSYMGPGTNLPTDTIILGWATEQFRVASGLFSIAADTSLKSNNLYFTTEVCTSGHFYAFSSAILPVPPDNPGDCGQSAVLLSRSTDNGLTWSSPNTLSRPSVNDQPFVTVDSQTGTVYVVYYTTQYDPFNHRTDVVASTSSNAGQTFHQQRITNVSNEPDSDPNMYNYLISAGFGGSFTLPQYGDYFEATALAGTLWVLFTANYAVEAGTFQTDPFLATLNQNGPPAIVP